MAQGKISYPSVFVVDSPTRPPPLPPKPVYRNRQKWIQTLLVILVSLALFGMTVEACFIYRLYSTKEQPVPPDEPQTAMRKQDKIDRVPSKHKLGEIKPSKPMAQLATNQKPVNGVILWNYQAILHHVKHSEDKLIIEKEGYYSVYSKINFHDDTISCSHAVLWITPRYAGSELVLLQSSRFRSTPLRPATTDNSYLSGVFHLYKDDVLFVRVKNCTLVLSTAAENYFGVFMV
ncbi:tumor necrosis factor ligand superfamily member 14 [Pseudorasbora parva]|uniref:tumor necrosis factor ligand superfamily member 14 n=1 Tax=Pseudorasbora parva TaxID=51549 RepID=UPI00351F09F0